MSTNAQLQPTTPQPAPLPEPVFWRIADVGSYLRISAVMGPRVPGGWRR